MEKDIGKIPKNSTADIVIRLDEFGGKKGLTIREFVTSERYTGFTKSGVKIPAEHFSKFKEMINSISEKEMEVEETENIEEEKPNKAQKTLKNSSKSSDDSEEMPDY